MNDGMPINLGCYLVGGNIGVRDTRHALAALPKSCGFFVDDESKSFHKGIGLPCTGARFKAETSAIPYAGEHAIQRLLCCAFGRVRLGRRLSHCLCPRARVRPPPALVPLGFLQAPV